MRMQDASQGGHLDFGLEFWFPDFCQKAPRGPIWTLDLDSGFWIRAMIS